MTEPAGDPRALLESLQRGLARVVEQAERSDPDEAASELTTVYMTDFEPLERYLLGRSPQDVRPLEIQFNALRGDLTAGLKGQSWRRRSKALTSRRRGAARRHWKHARSGAFGPAFIASLVTIVREGVEVILVVAMLLALVAKAAIRPEAANHGRVGLAIGIRAGLQCPGDPGDLVGSRAGQLWPAPPTAVVLNVLVVSASGAVREILEGVVLLAASGILFYVSYWLISQLEAKRWMDFLKKQARHGLELGGQGTLAITAFLAVYREGAETALMFQALLGSEGRTQAGSARPGRGAGSGHRFARCDRVSHPGHQRSAAVAGVLQVLGPVPVRAGRRLRRQWRLRASECGHPADDQSCLDGPWVALGGTLSQSAGRLRAGPLAGRGDPGLGRGSACLAQTGHAGGPGHEPRGQEKLTRVEGGWTCASAGPVRSSWS